MFEKSVLDKFSPHYTLPCQIGATGVSAGADGRKVIKAGTPVGGTVDVLLNRDTVLTVTNASGTGANAQGILVHDVDVTEGTATGTVAFMGVIDLAKTTVTIDTTVNLPRIIFMKGRGF